MPRGVPKNGYPKNRKSRLVTDELRQAISAGNKRRWQDAGYQELQHQSHLGIKPGGRIAMGHYVSQQGYRVITGQWDHPLSTGEGAIGEHRLVLYTKIGPGPHQCHWCGVLLEWGGREGIVADHMDFDKLNNDPENLVPACNECNWKRTE